MFMSPVCVVVWSGVSLNRPPLSPSSTPLSMALMWPTFLPLYLRHVDFPPSKTSITSPSTENVPPSRLMVAPPAPSGPAAACAAAMVEPVATPSVVSPAAIVPPAEPSIASVPFPVTFTIAGPPRSSIPSAVTVAPPVMSIVEVPLGLIEL